MERVRMNSRWVVGFLLMLLASPGLVGQAVPLPESLVAGAWGGSMGPYAAWTYLPGLGVNQEARGRFWFENSDVRQGVGVSWLLGLDGHSVGEKVEFYETAFRPTSICCRAGSSMELFVVGWDEQLGAVVVERWRLVDIAFGVAMEPTGEQVVALTYTIRRVRLATCTSLNPMSSAACHFRADELWMLEENSAGIKTVHSMPLSGASCGLITPLLIQSVQVDATNYPSLANCTSLSAQEHPAYGFVVLGQKRRLWESPWDYHEPYTIMIARDADKDGVMDSVVFPTYKDFYTNLPLETWNWKFH